MEVSSLVPERWEPSTKRFASIGVASMPGSADRGEKLIAAADAALYEAKRGGKNRVATAVPSRAAGRS
jgi:PleD family two-component response regulator